MGASTTFIADSEGDQSCDNPSKWGLQQHELEEADYYTVVITPQNGVFNNDFKTGEDIERL